MFECMQVFIFICDPNCSYPNLLFRRIYFCVPEQHIVVLRYQKKNPGKDWVPTLQGLEQSTVIISTGTTHHEVKEWMEQNHDTPSKVSKEVASKGKVELEESNESSFEEAAESDEGKEEVEIIFRDEAEQDLNEEEKSDGQPMENKESTKDEFDSDFNEGEEMEVKRYTGHLNGNIGKNVFYCRGVCVALLMSVLCLIILSFLRQDHKQLTSSRPYEKWNC